MVMSSIIVKAPTTAFYAEKILSKEAENIVAAIFTFCCEYFVVFLTQARIKKIKILVFNICFFQQKPVKSHIKILYIFFAWTKKQLMVNIFPPKINTF